MVDGFIGLARRYHLRAWPFFCPLFCIIFKIFLYLGSLWSVGMAAGMGGGGTGDPYGGAEGCLFPVCRAVF